MIGRMGQMIEEGLLLTLKEYAQKTQWQARRCFLSILYLMLNGFCHLGSCGRVAQGLLIDQGISLTTTTRT